MKTKLIYDSKIPKYLSVFISINAITLYPYIIFSKKAEDVSPITVNHEMIHIEQQKELWVIGFYLLYVLYWIKNLIKYRNSSQAYMNIPFEIEAYTNEFEADYLDMRPKHAWRIFKDITLT